MNLRLLVAAGAMLLTVGCSAVPASEVVTEEPASLVPSGPRLRVVLMSSLPLVHGDGIDLTAMIAGKSNPHPLHEDLKAAHDLVVADALDGDGLDGVDMVILVQPRALPPQDLVALDDYVRSGGRLLLFADPVLEWAGGRGLGDPQGPLRSSLISPLLKHWGIELLDPELGSVRLQPSGAWLVHPGQFALLSGKIGDANCEIENQGHVARCRPGRGRAVLVADADLIDPAMISNSAESAPANRRLVASLIAELMTKDTS